MDIKQLKQLLALVSDNDIAEFEFEKDGVKITAFKVDHGGEQLISLGYRIDYGGRSAVLSGDTSFNENVIKYSQGTDVLVHEVVHGMGEGIENANLERITKNHTPPDKAGEVFTRAKPRLAVFTHQGAKGMVFQLHAGRRKAGLLRD